MSGGVSPGDEQVLDARGLRCPEPVMMLHAAVRRAAPSARIRLLADDPSTTRDVPKFCAHLGHELAEQGEADGEFFYVVVKRPA
jgi:tRNA 2-thiouridine synthesizing protein A